MGNVHQHFRKEEYQFIDKILEFKNRVEDTYVDMVCPFLTPRQLKVASTLFSNHSVVQFYESPLNTERKRAIISYQQPTNEQFEECILEIDYPTKFYQLKHSSILGAILNCGVKRDFIGDIITDGTRWQIIVAKSIAVYICTEVKSIGRAKVKLHEVDKIVEAIDTGKKVDTLIASFRLDVIIAEAFNLSRAKAKEMVESGLVSVNWSVCEKSEYELSQQDMVSVRGMGRVYLSQVNGTTQKGKHKVSFLLFKNKSR